MNNSYNVHLLRPHEKQQSFIKSIAKRKIIRAGRRSGKTVGISIYAVQRFLSHHRVLYAAPTQEQIDRFWVTVSRALQEPIDAGALYKNETMHVIELSGTEFRIRAKTCWNADTLRGDYADEIIFDEYQQMNEDAWGVVGAPMLLDNDGNATFIYTPPALKSRSVSKATDPQHAAKLFKRFRVEQELGNSRYETFSFTSFDNPYISQDALSEVSKDMTAIAYRMEILAEDIDEAPGSLWKRSMIEKGRVLRMPPDGLEKIVVAIDPSVTSTGDEAGIIVAGSNGEDFYPLEDGSIQASPHVWAKAAVTLYNKYQADCIVAEANNGGEMVALTIATVDKDVPVNLVHASRGKRTRAEPISAMYENGHGHHVGSFPALEDEMVLWTPGDPSPNRMDALVWAAVYLLGGKQGSLETGPNPTDGYRG